MSESNAPSPPSQIEDAPPPRIERASTRGFRLAIVVMVGAFLIVVYQRDRIRSHWWARQITRSSDLAQQAHYLGLLMGAGEAGVGAVESLSRHERAEIRSLAVVALARIEGERGVEGLRRLLSDQDVDVAESAALSLAFLDGERGLGVLIEIAEHGAPDGAVAAVAVLPRIESPKALEAICRAASSHADARVRAQAVESLAAWLMANGRIEKLPCDPIGVLVAALDDQGRFDGLLSLERQIAAAEAVTRRGPSAGSNGVSAVSTGPVARTVREAAAENFERLTRRQIEFAPSWPATQRTEPSE